MECKNISRGNKCGKRGTKGRLRCSDNELWSAQIELSSNKIFDRIKDACYKNTIGADHGKEDTICHNKSGTMRLRGRAAPSENTGQYVHDTVEM